MTDEEMQGDPNQASAMPGQVVASVAGAGIGLAIGGPEGLLIGAGLTPLLTYFALADVRGRECAAGVIDAAAKTAEMTIDEVVGWADSDDVRFGLVAGIVEAAGRTRNEAKLRSFVRVLADGLVDDARIDLDAVIVSVIGSMERAHIEVLRVFADVPNPRPQAPDDGTTEYATEHLIDDLPRLAPAMHAIVSGLSASGCIELGGSRFGTSSWWRITHFGKECLTFLKEQGTEV